MKKYIRPVCAALCGLLLAGCAGTGGADHSDSTAESTEESEAQTLTVDDLEYYTRFRGQDISINVYNWGEYISTGADEGTLNVNAEFTKLTGIKVNYTNYATNEELYAKLKGGGAYYDVIYPVGLHDLQDDKGEHAPAAGYGQYPELQVYHADLRRSGVRPG